jgi:quinol monooxygenase YgiN
MADPGILVIASATAKPGNAAELIAAMREVAEPTRSQQGCISFSLYWQEDAGATIVGIERWASIDDHDRHQTDACFRRLASRIADLITEPPRIVTYTVIDE